MIDHRGELYDFRDKLNEVGCGFCFSKMDTSYNSPTKW